MLPLLYKLLWCMPSSLYHKDNNKNYMITTLAFTDFSGFGSIIWGVSQMISDVVALLGVILLTLALMIVVGGMMWPWFWNKKWKLGFASDAATLIGAGSLITVVCLCVVTLWGMGGLAAMQVYSGEGVIISPHANAAALNSDAFTTLRKMVHDNSEDKEILQVFQGGDRKKAVDERYHLNINMADAARAAALTKWARERMSAALDAWRSAYNMTFYTCLAAILLYLTFIWYRAFQDIKVD